MTVITRIRNNKRGLLASMAAAGALALTATFTLGGFNAAIANSSSTFSSATLQLEEASGGTTCYSTGTGGTGGTVTVGNSNTTCTINALTGTLSQVPGGTALSTTITLTNVGNINASGSTLTVSPCTIAAASNNGGYMGGDTAAGFCGHVDVTLGTSGTCIIPTSATACVAPTSANTLQSIATTGTFNLGALAKNTSATYTLTAQLDSSNATNADQGLTATVPLTWTINQ
jgi:hypothetical protein